MEMRGATASRSVMSVMRAGMTGAIASPNGSDAGNGLFTHAVPGMKSYLVNMTREGGTWSRFDEREYYINSLEDILRNRHSDNEREFRKPAIDPLFDRAPIGFTWFAILFVVLCYVEPDRDGQERLATFLAHLGKQFVDQRFPVVKLLHNDIVLRFRNVGVDHKLSLIHI